jgi:hypothetical protein
LRKEGTLRPDACDVRRVGRYRSLFMSTLLLRGNREYATPDPGAPAIKAAGVYLSRMPWRSVHQYLETSIVPINLPVKVLTRAGTTYNVSTHAESSTCNSSGFIRTMGPYIKLDSKMVRIQIYDLAHSTVGLVHPCQLMKESTRTIWAQVKISFVPFCCCREFRPWKLGQRMEPQSIYDLDNLIEE